MREDVGKSNDSDERKKCTSTHMGELISQRAVAPSLTTYSPAQEPMELGEMATTCHMTTLGATIPASGSGE
jgi:hypothetical protein